MKTAFPQTQNPVSIRLYANIPFDNTYEHHSLISDKFKYSGTNLYTGGSSFGSPCERFINRRRLASGYPYYYPRWDMTGEYNFDFKNGLMGSVTLELTPEQTNANYMRVTCGTDVYYYFITGISQDNFETYTLSLELDVIMTYQDEFLDGIENRPLFTERKHCHRYTNNGLYPHCADFKSGDSAFAGVKPSVITSRQDLHFSNSQLRKLEDVRWLYICRDADDTLADNDQPILYSFMKKEMPLIMCCIPIGISSMTFTDNNDTSIVITKDDITALIDKLVSNGAIHGCKISPYPPFNFSTGYTITKVDEDYTIKCNNAEMTIFVEHDIKAMRWSNNKTKLYSIDFATSPSGSDPILNTLIIGEEYDSEYLFGTIGLPNFANSVKPNPSLPKYDDPKLLFAPFKKYVLGAVYSGGYEIFPELKYSDGVFENNEFTFATLYTSYIGDNNVFTYLKPLYDQNGYVAFNDYRVNNIGLSCSINYLIPCGTNALDVFNSTQANSYYQSKIASGITSGLSIAGGVASTIVGGVTSNPMLLTAGATAIAGGTASMVNTIVSTNAKIEDLKNTPDSINVQGGSYTSDTARHNELPYVVIYDVTSVIKNNANDYFYNYGYEVSRDCGFFTDIAYNNNVSKLVDNQLIGRSVFNYIKLKEDITCKINANIPLLVKQKLSQVFNKGITLWSFFGLAQLWGTTDTPNPDYNIDNWFLQHELDNTEYSLIAE